VVVEAEDFCWVEGGGFEGFVVGKNLVTEVTAVEQRSRRKTKRIEREGLLEETFTGASGRPGRSADRSEGA